MGMFWWFPFGKVPEVSADQLDAMRKDGRAQILDVRTGPEYRSSHVPGALHTPVTDFSAQLARLQLDKSRPVIAICLSAHRSIPAVRTLQKQGFREACQLKGGMRAWWKEKLPVEGDGSVDVRAAGGSPQACATAQVGAVQDNCAITPATSAATDSTSTGSTENPHA